MSKKAEARAELARVMDEACALRIAQLLRDGRVLIDTHENMSSKKRKSFGDYTWRDLKTKK